MALKSNSLVSKGWDTLGLIIGSPQLSVAEANKP